MGWGIAVQQKKYRVVYAAVIQEENQIEGGEPQERGHHRSLDKQMVQAKLTTNKSLSG